MVVVVVVIRDAMVLLPKSQANFRAIPSFSLPPPASSSSPPPPPP